MFVYLFSLLFVYLVFTSKVLIQRDANGMYICVYCGDTFTKKETLITHIKSNHKGKNNMGLVNISKY